MIIIIGTLYPYRKMAKANKDVLYFQVKAGYIDCNSLRLDGKALQSHLTPQRHLSFLSSHFSSLPEADLCLR